MRAILLDAPYGTWRLSSSKLHLGLDCDSLRRIRDRLSYSNTLGWNTFPVPTLTDKNKADLTRCAEDILLAREEHFPATIADLYDPDAMPDDLRQRMSVTTKCWSAFTSAAASRTTPSGWKSCSISTLK